MGSATDLESGLEQGAQAEPQAALVRPSAGIGGSGSALPGGSAQPAVVSQAETADKASLKRGPSGGGDQPTQTGQLESPSQVEAQQIPRALAGDQTVQGPRDARNEASEGPRMIGDFDGSANEFWKLFIGEVKGDDDARINTLKEGMDSALIFAGLFSAVLTAFVVDSKQNLKPSPADETVYYLQQHSIILTQISVQLSSIVPQVAIPSTPPPPFPSFTPSASDVRINAFWFMSLAFSLLAALMAILVQQWVRNYMHVFQRYGDPLKSSRVRQYLYEGSERWYMPRVSEAVPGFLHVSLLLFFVGLGDALLNINTKVALSAIVPIGIGGLLYIFVTFAPIIYPQSPYQNTFSGIFWYLIQKLHGRRFRDRGPDGGIKPVSANMAQGQMQLAMEETSARMGRDVTAIRWLINNLTEDAEMERFLLAMPGSFNTDWGTKVWERVGKHDEGENQYQDEPLTIPHVDTTAHRPPSSWSIRSILRPIIHLFENSTPYHPSTTHTPTRLPVLHAPNLHPHSTTAHFQEENVVYKLSTRVARSVKICTNRGRFSNNDDLRQRRTRACIEATASLICCSNAKPAWFGDISELLGEIGTSEKIRESSLAGTDELFVMRWTCLSLVAIRLILEDNSKVTVRYWSALAMKLLAEDDQTGNDGLTAAHRIDETFKRASGCLLQLYGALRITEDLTEEAKEILRGHESDISKLEQIDIEADRLEEIDFNISETRSEINLDSRQIISQFPGILDDFGPQLTTSIPFSRFIELSHDSRKLLFMPPAQTLKSMCSPSLILRSILEGQGDADAYKELLKNLKEYYISPLWRGDEMRHQLWYMHDLTRGSGLGFTVQLFFLAFSQLLRTSSSNESHSTLYTGTFRAITSDWSERKHCVGTQNVLLNITISRRDEFADPYYLYPAYIIDEFLSLLSCVLEGQTNPEIDRVRKWFGRSKFYDPLGYREKVLRVLTRVQAQQSPAS